MKYWCFPFQLQVRQSKVKICPIMTLPTVFGAKSLIWLSVTFHTFIACADAVLTVLPEIACPGETVTLTCDLPSSGDLVRWRLRFGDFDSQRVVVPVSIGMTLTFEDSRLADFGFQITATGTGSGSNRRITSSEFTFPANVTLNGGTVECAFTGGRDTVTLQITSSVPQTPSEVTIDPDVQFTSLNATVVIRWSVVSLADNYTIEISPGSRSTTTDNNMPLTISFNTEYSVAVFASNCIGNSGMVTRTVRVAGCPPPSPPANGRIYDYPSGAVGVELSFQCNEGYLPSQPFRTTCQASGTWSRDPATHTCREIIDCGNPSPALQVNIEPYTSTTEGSVIFFMCEEGLMPDRREMATCGSDGRWDPDPANHHCGNQSSVDCGDPQAPENGVINSYTSTIEGAQITSQCNNNPTITITSTCSSIGTWEPDPTTLMCQASTSEPSNPIGQPSGDLSSAAVYGIIAVICSLFFLFMGLIIGLICGGGGVYIFMRRKQSPGKLDESGSMISQDPKPPPVYEVIDTSPSSKEEIELQGNMAYGPIKQKH